MTAHLKGRNNNFIGRCSCFGIVLCCLELADIVLQYSRFTPKTKQQVILYVAAQNFYLVSKQILPKVLHLLLTVKNVGRLDSRGSTDKQKFKNCLQELKFLQTSKARSDHIHAPNGSVIFDGDHRIGGKCLPLVETQVTVVSASGLQFRAFQVSDSIHNCVPRCLQGSVLDFCKKERDHFAGAVLTVAERCKTLLQSRKKAG